MFSFKKFMNRKESSETTPTLHGPHWLHGTNQKFEGAPAASPTGGDGPGVYISNSKHIASYFAALQNGAHNSLAARIKTGNNIHYPDSARIIHLTPTVPLRLMNIHHKDHDDLLSHPIADRTIKLHERAKSLGYHGLWRAVDAKAHSREDLKHADQPGNIEAEAVVFDSKHLQHTGEEPPLPKIGKHLI